MREEFGCAFVLIFVRMASPESVFVELEVFIGDATKYHSAEAAIADGKGFDPFLRGLFIPECEGRIRGESGLAQND